MKKQLDGHRIRYQEKGQIHEGLVKTFYFDLKSYEVHRDHFVDELPRIDLIKENQVIIVL